VPTLLVSDSGFADRREPREPRRAERRARSSGNAGHPGTGDDDFGDARRNHLYSLIRISLSVTSVIKIGGSLARVDGFDRLLAEISRACRGVSLLIVPGGGTFADAVRDVDRRLGLADDAAHWMAVLAMDQYAHLIASRMPGATLVFDTHGVMAALETDRIPVLAPYRWMRDADPLPHSWDVTSDSISAWVAGQVGAPRLVLVKPAGASGPEIVDPCFDRFRPRHLETLIVTVDRIDDLTVALTGQV
jgi:aspartokinase-like uncharacterized kinase